MYFAYRYLISTNKPIATASNIYRNIDRKYKYQNINYSYFIDFENITRKKHYFSTY